MAQTAYGPIILLVGTRPEGIKMIPLYCALKESGFKTVLCSTAQHDELLTEVFDLFGVQPDFNLNIMMLGQDPFYITQSVLQKTKTIFTQLKPALVMVHGDTSTTMAAALSAFYLGIPVAHVEAGLRTDSVHEPFPEEMNRRVVSVLADYHFAPTSLAAANLLAQGIEQSKLFCTGNTIVDALRIMKSKIDCGTVVIRDDITMHVNRCKKENKKIIVLTVHRRESFDGGIVAVLQAVKQFLIDHPDVVCFYPFHPNPKVLNAIAQVDITSLPNIHMFEPLAYKDMVYLLQQADFAITDSGGIQEEMVSLGKPAVVVREKTERTEGVWAGLLHVVGTDRQKIGSVLCDIYEQKEYSCNKNEVYGDGYAAQKIVAIIRSILERQNKYSNKLLAKKSNTTIVHHKKRDITVKKVCVLGLGYIGLPTAIVTVEHGFDVVGFDIDKKRVDCINAGDPVICEPEIFERLQVAIGSQQFRATTVLEPADYFVIAVPTPFKENNKADLSCVFAAAQTIATQSSTISWITAWISAFHLGLVLASMFFLSEGLALIFFYLYLLFFYKSFSVYGEPEKPAAYKNLAYAALALGIGTWIRPMGEFIAFITFLLIAVLGRDTLKKKGKKILLFALIFFGSISPWYIRNYQLTGKCFFCPMLGPYLTSFVAPKVMRRAYDMPLAQSINMLYNLSDKKRAEQTQALRGTGKMVPRETPCVSVALPIILKYPWYTFQEWMKEVFKTAFDLYSSQLVAFAKKTNHYDPIEEFLFVKIRDCLYAQPMPPLMRLICWLELLFALLLWIGIIAGTALFLIFPLCKRTALSHNGFLFLKTLPIIGAICFITGGFGYARLRLPVEPLMILLALTFWCWVIAQKKQTVKQKRVTA